MSRSLLRCGFFIMTVGFCVFALSPALEAGCPNPPGICFGANTAVGEDALFNVTTGVWNVGVGFRALFNTTDGNQNTGVGYQSLFNNISGDHSTAIGGQALYNNTSGNDNVGVGFNTLFTNTTGNRNTGMGYRTLAFNSAGNDNTAVGWNALYNNRTITGDSGFQNTAAGSQALFHNRTGDENTAVGAAALEFNADGSQNTAVGRGAGPNIINGFNNTYVGDFVGTLAPDENNTIRIGDLSNGNGAWSLACFIGGIFNNFQPVGGAVVEVTLDLATDELGWDVGPNQAGSAPVQRRGRAEPQAMLNGKVEKLEATVAQLTQQLKEQAAQIQRVSAQLATSSPSHGGLETTKFARGRIRGGGPVPQVVNNP